jgi:16S rRNA (guanine527-N7)-methyltransferase
MAEERKVEMREEFRKLMEEKLEEFSLNLCPGQIDQFYAYYELLIEWNKVMNLTSIVEMEDVVVKHFIDSLSLVKVISREAMGAMKVLDLGTGAGFPGIPLKIAFPDMRITLLDSLNKRIKFLNEVIGKLELSGVDAVHGRAEDYGRDSSYRETYDLCVSRAVAKLSTLLEYCTPFVKTGGYFISYKSEKAEEEIRQAKGALKLLGCRVETVEEFQLSGSDIGRTLIKIRKTEGTSKKYPRKAGLPSKEPL